jgi:hypothetical protein
MARYFTPTPSQYISQFVPPDLDLMYKVGQEKAANDAAITDSLDKADQEWKVKGGIFTNKQDAELFNQETEANLSKIKDAFYTGSIDSFQAARAINRLQGVVKNNPKYRLYKLDEKLTESIMPNLVSGKLNEAIGVPLGNGLNSIDLRGGQLKVNTQIDPNSTTEEQLANLYNAQTPGDFAKDHPDFIQQASVPKIISAAENAGYKVDKSNPDMPVFVNYKTGHKIKGITKETVRPFAKKYAEENYYSTSRESVEYMRRAGETVDDYTDRLTSLIMYGITDKDITRDIKGSPMSTEKEGEESGQIPPPPPPDTYPTSGATLDFGTNYKNFMDPIGVNALDNYAFKQEYGDDFDFSKINDPNSDEYEWISQQQGQIAFFEDDVLEDPFDLPEQDKKILRYFIENKPINEYSNAKKWGHLSRYLDDDLPVEFPTKRALYADFFTAMKEFKGDLVRVNNTAVNLNYDTPRGTDNEKAQQELMNQKFKKYSGAQGEEATGAQVINTAVNKGTPIYSESDNKILTLDDLTKLAASPEAQEKISSILETTPENTLSVLTGDKDFVKAGIISIGGKRYYISDRARSKADNLLNDMYTKGMYSMGLPITHEFQGKKLTYSIDRDNKVTLYTNKTNFEFETVAQMLSKIMDAQGNVNPKAVLTNRSNLILNKKEENKKPISKSPTEISRENIEKIKKQKQENKSTGKK